MTKMGFIPEQNRAMRWCFHDVKVLFVPAESGYPDPELTENAIILHEDIWQYHKTAVINRLLALTGATKRIHGRACELKRIDAETARLFLQDFHTGGFANSYFKYGLFYKNELMAVGLFSKCRSFQTADHQLYKSAELTRFACKTGIRIIGGMDKLISAFCKEFNVLHLMTYADKEWTDGKAYYTLGFQKVADTPPLHFLINRQTGQRVIWKNNIPFDKDAWIPARNQGNIKLIRTKNPR